MPTVGTAPTGSRSMVVTHEETRNVRRVRVVTEFITELFDRHRAVIEG